MNEQEGISEPLSLMRRRIGAHMLASTSASPHVAQAVEVDFSAVEAVRSVVADSWRGSEGFSLTYLPFIAYALCRSIIAHPHVNASVHDRELHVHAAVHLGIAVDLDFEGLIVPVIRNAETLTVADLARAARALADRARARALTPDDVNGGSYTISNPGGYGTFFTTPIINQPQVAILSTEGVRKRAVVVEHIDGHDSIEIRPTGVLVQSFDHRAFDGAYSASFLHRLRSEIEETDWSELLYI